MQERTTKHKISLIVSSMTLKHLAIALMLQAFSLSASPVLAQVDSPDAAAEDARVIFGGSGFYPPFHFTNDQGLADGFDVSIFNRIAGQNSWNTDYRLDDWQTVQQALGNGEVDVVPMFVSAERQALYLFSDPVHVEYHLLFGPATSDAYASLAALSTQRVAAEGGAYATSELLKTNPDVVIVSAASEAEALTLVDLGQADLALLPSEIGRYTLRTRQLDHLAALSPPLLPVTYAFAINPARPELLAAVNAGIERLQRQGELESLRNRWLYADSDDSRERALLIVSWTLPLLLVLAAAGLLIVRFYRHRLDEVHAQILNRRPTSPNHQSRPGINTSTHALTGLPDRKHLLHQLDYEITVARHQRRKRGFAIISLLNLDALQDAFDDEAGDELIKQFSAAIPQEWASNCAYLGPGVFGFIVKDTHNIEQTINALIIQLGKSVMIRDLSIHPQLCAGLAVYPDQATTAADLMHKAKMAMNQAKRSGACLLMYCPDMKPDPRRIQVISDLRHALTQRQLQWAVQPQFNVSDSCVYGAELLARWNHHKHGWLPPADFIVWAEEAGLISQVSDQVIQETAALFELMASHQDPFYLSINLSANDLGDDALVESLISKIRGRKASHLTLEVTETALMMNKKAALRNIDRLKLADFRVALDDYGTGYASMEYLQSFNFDEIKIDRRFVNNMTTITRDRKLTQACIELGHQLGAKVVAEGVENPETAAMLIDMGCDVLQGYQIGEPVLLGDFYNIRQTWRQVTL